MQKRVIETRVSVYSFDELPTGCQQLINAAKEQVSNAYAPYSGFHVGAAVLLENGEIFAGNNQENSAYPSSLCAERVAMFYANARRPDVPASAIAIAAFAKGRFVDEPVTPCGSCRQVLLETEIRFNRNIKVLLYGEKEIYMIDSIKDLLPLSFGKSNLK
ncbi:MAG: cytidine deaminase [Prevotellaceae bacterium]|jgi:cytidine deaminase|nr:cytidine deaminase [Prevotellaceae bacterium]